MTYNATLQVVEVVMLSWIVNMWWTPSMCQNPQETC